MLEWTQWLSPFGGFGSKGYPVYVSKVFIISKNRDKYLRFVEVLGKGIDKSCAEYDCTRTIEFHHPELADRHQESTCEICAELKPPHVLPLIARIPYQSCAHLYR